MSIRSKRLTIIIALAGAVLPALLVIAQESPADKNLQFFKGKVVPLAELLAKQGAKLDADAAPAWLALVSDDNKIYPLVKDAGSRMFFKDAKLLNRPMRLTGKLIPGSQLLQVINVHSIVGGKLHDVYYWCDICTIRGYEAGICDCCGDPMVFRETPVK
jgi:hypothetical protein